MIRFRVRHSWRRLLAGTVAAALSMGLVMVGAASNASAASGSTLTVALETQVSTFNPFLAYFDGELDAIAMAYPTLVWPGADSKPTHYLADSWNVSPDKLTWTFHLHKGLKWSDGKPLTAHDVAWTLNLIMHNKTAATANGSLVTNFASVTAPDDNTVVVKTKTPQANMLYVVGLPIVPEHIWQSKVASLGSYKNFDFPVVGYGPYQITGYKTDQYATLKANKNFFLGAPHYDTLILQYFKNTDAAVAALRSGQVQQVPDLTATDFKALSKDNGIKTYQAVGNSWDAVEINPGAKTITGKKIGTGNPILSDPRVREAIALGINRPALVQKVLDGLGQPGAGYLPPAFPQWFWKPSPSQALNYNPARAKSILDAAGYKMGSGGIRVDSKTGKPLSFRLGIHSDSISDSQIAGYLVGWMKDIGIKLTIQSMSMTALNDNLAKGDWDLLMDGWGTGPDPTYLLSIQTCGVLPQNNGTGGNTDSFTCNPQYDKLYKQQQQQFNTQQRAQTIKKMEQILYRTNDDIILYYSNSLNAVSDKAAKGYVWGSPNKQGFYPYQNLTRSWITADPPASSSSSGSSNTGLIIGIVVAVVVVALIVVFFLWRRRTTAAERE